MPSSSKSFTIAFALIALASSSASAATVTYLLDTDAPGQFKVYGAASTGDNFGIAGWGFELRSVGGTITSQDNLSPWGLRTNGQNLGFSDVRFPLSDGSTVPDSSKSATSYVFSGFQLVASGSTANFIYGFGQTPGNFASLYGANYDAAVSTSLLDATNQQSWDGLLLLAQGTYTGFLQFGNSPNNLANVWATNDRTRSAPIAQVVTTYKCIDCVYVDGVTIDNVDPNNPGMVMATLTASSTLIPPFPYNWSILYSSYTPAPGASGSGAVVPPTIDPTTGKFSWNTAGSPLGTYNWTVRAGNDFGEGLGFLKVTLVPEPTTLSLISLAMIAGLGLTRRRAW